MFIILVNPALCVKTAWIRTRLPPFSFLLSSSRHGVNKSKWCYITFNYAKRTIDSPYLCLKCQHSCRQYNNNNNNMVMHGEFQRNVGEKLVEYEQSSRWLKFWDIKGKAESTIVAVQGQAVTTNYFKNNAVRLQMNGAVSKVNKKFISHLTRAKRTPSAAATVQVSHALPAVLFSCLLWGRGVSFQDGAAAGKGFLCAPFWGVQNCDYSAAVQ